MEGQGIADIVCVQNHYSLALRDDDALIELQSATLSDMAAELSATPMQVALGWLLQRSPNILLIPGRSSMANLHENLAVADLHLPDAVVSALEAVASGE